MTQKKYFLTLTNFQMKQKFCEEFFLSCHRFFERNSQGIKPNSNE